MIHFSSFFYVWIYLSCGSSLLLLTAERQDSDRDSTTTMDESRISSSEDATDEAGYFGASRNISSQKYSKMLRKTQNIHINVVNTTIIWIISIWISIFFHVVKTIIKNNQASPIESPEMDGINHQLVNPPYCVHGLYGKIALNNGWYGGTPIFETTEIVVKHTQFYSETLESFACFALIGGQVCASCASHFPVATRLFGRQEAPMAPAVRWSILAEEKRCEGGRGATEFTIVTMEVPKIDCL